MAKVKRLKLLDDFDRLIRYCETTKNTIVGNNLNTSHEVSFELSFYYLQNSMEWFIFKCTDMHIEVTQDKRETYNMHLDTVDLANSSYAPLLHKTKAFLILTAYNDALKATRKRLELFPHEYIELDKLEIKIPSY